MHQLQRQPDIHSDGGPIRYRQQNDRVQCQSELNSYSRLQASLHELLVKPRTRKGQIYCWLSWVAILVFVAVVFWQALPRFVDHGRLAQYVCQACHDSSSSVTLYESYRCTVFADAYKTSFGACSCEAYNHLHRGNQKRLEAAMSSCVDL